MVVKLRMQRFGRVRTPFYKIVAIDSRKARNAQPIEYLGTWDPLPDKDGRKSLRLSEDRIKYWLTVGAQPSDAVAKLLWRVKMLPKPPVTYKPTRSTPKSEREFSTLVASDNSFDRDGSILSPPLPAFPSLAVDNACDDGMKSNFDNHETRVVYAGVFSSLMKSRP